MTDLVTESDEMPGAEAATSNNNEALAFGPRESQLARTRDADEPTTVPGEVLDPGTDSDIPADSRPAAARAGEGLAALLAGPAGWPLVTRRHPSVQEVFRHGQASAGWDHPAGLVRWPVRAFWYADAIWETGCMTARVWWRTRITWAITVLAVVAFLVWGA